jgi:nucleoside-diphosphate-sugar epimerase
MRVGVTGATGFVGGALADALEAAGHDVLTTGRRPRAAGMHHRYVAWDLARDVPPPTELGSCDAIVHVAAHVAPWGPRSPFQEITVVGTTRLLDAIDPQARLIVIGSSSVYDPRVAHVAAREAEAPVAAGRYVNEYARAKADQERVVAARRPDALILRPRAIWGPGDRTLLPRALARVRGSWLPLPDGGRHLASTTHVSSLGAAVVAAVACSDVRGPLNVADATPRPTAILLRTLLAAIGRPVRIVPVPAGIAGIAAGAVEAGWRLTRRRAEPPLTRYAVAGFRPFTLDLDRLHGELGVAPDVDLILAAAEVASARGLSRR